MDRRGRGGSTDGQFWTPDHEVEDVVAVVEALAHEVAMPVDVLGHSFGGYLALRAAARTDHVRRLVLYEPATVRRSCRMRCEGSLTVSRAPES